MRATTLLTAVFLLSGCSTLAGWLAPSRTINAQAAGPLILAVCDQHDESVLRDPVLVQAEKDQALLSTSIVRDIVKEAQGGK